ncbi:MAG: EamA family transporter, partial [Thermodesulfobacteriota bacterium]|nr:EamA family transporter [Thermodesulfobacteriota bacterium]
LGLFSAPCIHDYVFLSRNQILLLILISVLSTFAQFLMTEAIRFSKATIAVVVGYIGVIFSTLWEFLFWNALPDLFTVLGGIFIGIAVAFLATQKTKHYSA